MQFTLNQGDSTPRNHLTFSPQQPINHNYNQLVNQYSDLQQEMYSQKQENQVKYQQIIQKIDGIYNELTTNINQLTFNSRADYQQLLNELKQQREYNIQMINSITHVNQPLQKNNLQYIDQQEQQLLEDLQTLDSYKLQRIDYELQPTSRIQSNYLSPPNNHRVISKQNSNYIKVQHTPLQSTQYSSNQLRQQYGIMQQERQSHPQEERQSYGRIAEFPLQNRSFENPIKITDEIQVEHKIAYSPYQVKQNQQQYFSVQQQVHAQHKPIFEQQITQKSRISGIEPIHTKCDISQNHIPQEFIKIENNQNIRQLSQQSLPAQQFSQQPSAIHHKEKIFDVSHLSNNDKINHLQQPINQTNQILNVSQFQLDRNDVIPQSNMVPINNQILTAEHQQNLNDSQQSYIMDLYGNLGYDQFYSYLTQRYPINNQLNNKPNHGDQRILRQDQESLDLMQYIYCTLCDQFISMKQANNHMNFCIKNKNQTKYDDKYLDLFICCNDPMNEYIESKEQKQRRLSNELIKIKYLIEIALKQKVYTHEQQKQKEYCLFALEIMALIIQNPKNVSIQQQVQDLISIYQVLDQQQYNFYKQIVFLLQKANVRIQQLIN